MTDWSALCDAYGPADDIPVLLAQLDPDPHADVWGELWQRICHQGSVYSASFAAMPQLAGAAASWRPEERSMVLALAAAIVCGDTQSAEFAGMRSKCADEIESLRALTAESIATAGIPAEDFIYVLQASIAFDGSTFWATHLDRLAQGEFEASCPHCDTLLFVAIGDYGFFTSADDYALESNVAKGPLHAAQPAELTGVEKRLYEGAIAGGHDKIAELLSYLFGDATCARCGGRFHLPDRIEAVYAA